MWDFPHRAWPPVELQSFAHSYNGPTPSDSSRSDRDMGRGIVDQITFWSAILNAPHAPLLSKSRAFGRRCGLNYSYSRPALRFLYILVFYHRLMKEWVIHFFGLPFSW